MTSLGDPATKTLAADDGISRAIPLATPPLISTERTNTPPESPITRAAEKEVPRSGTKFSILRRVEFLQPRQAPHYAIQAAVHSVRVGLILFVYAEEIFDPVDTAETVEIGRANPSIIGATISTTPDRKRSTAKISALPNNIIANVDRIRNSKATCSTVPL